MAIGFPYLINHNGLDFNQPGMNLYVDLCIYSMLQFYFMPAVLLAQGTNIEQLVPSVFNNRI
jgi:hypothetical protein